ncbi:MAG: S8 family serine peptidase, partial [Dehalococcoidia bacterium]|nr:S8 family serine peptidase [Dehalococcoidia bacterium]
MRCVPIDNASEDEGYGGAMSRSLSMAARKTQLLESVLLEVYTGRQHEVAATLMGRGVRAFHRIAIGPLSFVSIDNVPVKAIAELRKVRGILRLHADPVLRLNLMTPRVSRAMMPSGTGTEAVWKAAGMEIPFSEGHTGRETRVCVIDTGTWVAHEAFKGTSLESVAVVPNVGAAVGDSSGHGTWVAAQVSSLPNLSPQGFACRGMSEAELVTVKALRTRFGVSRPSDVLKAVEIGLGYDPKIFSLSLGGPAEDSQDVDPLAKTMNWLTDQGKLVCLAAGNDGQPKSINTPGIASKAITVGAVDMSGKLASFSSRGPTIDGLVKPDVCFYGYELVGPTAFWSKMDATDARIGIRPRAPYGLLSGTSMSTPGV